VLRLLRQRDFALLIAGQAVSDVGDGIFAVALAWRVYQSYANPAALSVVGIAFFLPRLLMIIVGGVVSDRFDRRRTMIAADTGRGLAVALLATLSFAGMAELIAIASLVALQGIAGSLFAPSESALLPQLVPAADLGRANSVRTIVTPMANAVAGPALGGAVIALRGTQAAFWIDSATYGVSVLTLLLMRGHFVSQREKRRSVFRDAKEGFAYVAGRPWLWGPILTASLAQFLFAGPQQSLVPYLVKFELHASAGALGIVLACGGLGTMAAGLVTGRLGTPRHIVTFMILGWASGIGAIALLGVAQTVWEAAAAVFIWNLLLWTGEILWLTLLGLTVPNHIRGRVSSIDFLGSYWLIPLSMALTGPLATLIGARTVLIGAGVGGAAAILATLLIPRVRQPVYLEGKAPATA